MTHKMISCVSPSHDLLLTAGMLVVAAPLSLLVPELLAEVCGAAVEFVSTEMFASITAELLCPAPKVKREPAEREKKRGS